MKPFMVLIFLMGDLLAVTEHVPAAGDSSTIVGALVGGAAVGFGSLILGLIRESRRGKQQNSVLIAEATESAVKAAKEMIEEYQHQLEILKQEHSRARERIAVLESELEKAVTSRELIREELTQAQKEIVVLRGRITHLENLTG